MDLKYNRDDIREFLCKNIYELYPLAEAMKNGKLIIFVGSGMSVHLGVPGWQEFAKSYLDLIYNNSNLTLMNYKTKESLKREDTKKLLSICKFVSSQNMSSLKISEWYQNLFNISVDKLREKKLYEKLYNLNAIYITTNYDNALDLLAEQDIITDLKTGNSEENELLTKGIRGKVYYDPEQFCENILKIGNVIHIHGSIKNPKTMVISYEDYINKYGINSDDAEKKGLQKKYSEFLSYIFKKDYTVLFIGYGVEEFEILQYMLDEKLKNKPENKSLLNRYLLLPCYCDDYYKISYIANYYKNYYGIEIIPYDLTDKGHDMLENVLDSLFNIKNKEGQDIVSKTDEIIEGLSLIEEL